MKKRIWCSFLALCMILTLVNCIPNSVKADFSNAVTIEEGTYHIAAPSNSNQVITVMNCSTNEGEIIQMWDASEYEEYTFRIERVSDSYYKIISTYSGLAVTACDDGRIRQYSYNGSSDQNWSFYDSGNGEYVIQSQSGSYLYTNSVYNGGTISGDAQTYSAWLLLPWGTPTFYAMVVNGIEGEKDYGTDMDAGLMYTSLCKNELAGYLMDEKNIHPFAYNIDSNPISGDILYNWVTHSFSETRGSDLSVFYYSGHGSTDIFPFKRMGEYATGISWTNLLKTLAGNIKGKIVVILDACHSGNLIIEGVDQLSNEDLARITILTSCTLDETSQPRSVLPFRNLIYGNFTSAIGYGIGFFDGKMNADANGDAVVTVGELYDYADKEVTKHDSDMHVQFYGHDPNLPLFEYQEGGITILSQPKDYMGAANSTAQFSVFAVGGGLTYQWQISDDGGKTWSNSSVKSPAYSVKLTQNRDGRLLRCVISNGNDHIITSNTVSMRIAKLTITKQPVNYLGLVNSAATFSLSAEGEGLTYQWQISDNGGQKWTNSSVKKPEYGTKLTAARDGRMVRCIVSDQYGNTVTSDAVRMTAMYQLEITGQPSDYYGPVNSTAKFSVTAKGTDLTYQWQFSDDGGATWKKSSVTSSVYSAKLTAAKDGRLVRCIVTGGDGHLSTTSNAAAMHIQSGPTITTQPKNYVGKLSSSVTFTVAAQGDGLTYQWQFSDNDGAKWTNSSEKSAVYNTKLTSARDGRLVRCIVTDANGVSTISDTASMTIG